MIYREPHEDYYRMPCAPGDSMVDSTTSYSQARTAEWANNIPQAGTVPATQASSSLMPTMDLKINPQDAFWQAQYAGYPLNMMNAENMAFSLQMQNILMSSAQVSSTSISPAPKKKKPTPVPAELKDETYMERRAKNNDSAKRSREARRKKEEEAHIELQRVTLAYQRLIDFVNNQGLQRLTLENQRLRMELYSCQAEVERLRMVCGMNAPNPGFMH